MIQAYVDRFMESRGTLREQFAVRHPGNYREIVKMVIEAVRDKDNPIDISPDRINPIDDGDGRGVLVYVVADSRAEPRDYWFVKVEYGSCPGCDTLEGVRGYDDGPPTNAQIDDYMTLALHIVQGIKPMQEGG